MKVKFTFPINGEEADVSFVHNSESGVLTVTVEPYFYSPEASPTVCSTESIAECGEVLHSESTKVSGRSGKIGRVVKGSRVKPRADTDPVKEQD